jgi:hypothetical protein
MSTTSSRRPGHAAGPGPAAPLAAELTRARRVRWLLVGLAALVLLGALWAFGVRPAGVDLPTLLLGAAVLIAALYALDAAISEWRSRRLLRLSTVQEQRRHDLAEEVARLDRVDLAARHLADATTLEDAAGRLRSAARELAPARQVGVLLRAADDLLVSVEGPDDGSSSSIGARSTDLASRALARGAALRGSQGDGAGPRNLAPRVAVPLRSGAEVVGVLVLERGADAAPFTPAEQRALERLAPHGGRALARAVQAGAGSPAAADPTASVNAAATAPEPEDVDLAVLVPAIADTAIDAEAERARRVVVLAPTAARIHADPVAVTTVLEGLLRLVHEHAPPEAAIAIEVLAFDEQAEVVIAHAGGVLPDELLDEPRDDVGEVPALRPAVTALGGTVSVRDRSGVPQVRVRLPVTGHGDEAAAQVLAMGDQAGAGAGV